MLLTYEDIQKYIKDFDNDQKQLAFNKKFGEFKHIFKKKNRKTSRLCTMTNGVYNNNNDTNNYIDIDDYLGVPKKEEPKKPKEKQKDK